MTKSSSRGRKKVPSFYREQVFKNQTKSTALDCDETKWLVFIKPNTLWKEKSINKIEQ